jgi:hypothetical protein
LSIAIGAMEETMAARAASVKRYVVRLSAEERRGLEAIIHKGKSSAARLLKARILFEGGCFRSRRRLERQPDRRGSGNQRFHSLPSAQAAGGGRPRGGSEPQGAGPAFRAADFRRREGSAADRSGLLPTPEGHARWSLRLLESKVVELGIVEAASDSMIQRVLKKTRSSRTAANTGSFRPRPAALS